MDDSLREKCSANQWRAELARWLDEQRHSARTLLAGQRERFKTLEAQLVSRLDELVAVLDEQRLKESEREEDVARRELLLAQRDAGLAERLQELAGRETQWSLGLRETQEKQQAWLADLAQRMAAFDTRQAELSDLECRLQVQQVACSRREAELEQQAQDLAERLQKVEQFQEQAAQRQAALDQSREELRQENEQLRGKLEELKQAQAELQRDREALADREQETQRQRRHVAQQLRARKNELVAEVELHRAEALNSSHGQELQLQIRLSELQAKYDRTREELAERDAQQGTLDERITTLLQQLQAREDELHAVTAQAEAARRQLAEQAELAAAELAAGNEQLEQEREKIRAELRADFAAQEQQLAAQLAKLQRQCDGLQAELDEARSAAAQAASAQMLEVDLSGEVARLQEENQRLQQQLVEAQSRSGGSSGSDSEELEDLRNRLEMAVHDVRELKSKNAELTDQLARAKRASSSAPAAAGADLGWEAQKQRLLQQLEDFDEGDEEQHVERLKIEEAIRATDRAVTEKDQEIEELRQLLQNQSDNIGNVAVGAAAIASMLDSDELIRQERENVKGLQAELEEKLRKAEVDISLERAKLARERVELEEKLQALEQERSQLAAAYGEAGVDQAGKGGKPPARGRWLARLGIQGDDGK